MSAADNSEAENVTDGSGAGRAVVGAAERADEPTVPVDDRTRFVVVVTLAFGLLWEVLEYVVHALGDRIGFEPLLVHYGRLDAVGDLVFDAVGAALVVVFGRRALSNVVDSFDDDGDGARDHSR